MLAALSIIFIAIGIAFMYVGIRICRDLWHAHIGLLIFVIGLCLTCMAIQTLMEV
nr:MAG TPA: hypothetical protein [Caudoviricetes sp.]